MADDTASACSKSVNEGAVGWSCDSLSRLPMAHGKADKRQKTRQKDLTNGLFLCIISSRVCKRLQKEGRGDGAKISCCITRHHHLRCGPRSRCILFHRLAGYQQQRGEC